MTDEELAAMEARDALTQRFDPVKIAQERFLLLQEVKRLRVLGKQAADFLEGHCDEGPIGEGWKSDELRALIRELGGDT